MAESGNNYATIADVMTLFRPLSEEETVRVEPLLTVVSARLRYEANKVGKDLDTLIAADPDLAEVAKSVTVDVVARILMTPTASNGFGPMTQMSQAAGGYSVSGSFLNPGGGVFIKDAELKALGLKRQKYGVLELYADPRDYSLPLQ